MLVGLLGFFYIIDSLGRGQHLFAAVAFIVLGMLDKTG